MVQIHSVGRQGDHRSSLIQRNTLEYTWGSWCLRHLAEIVALLFFFLFWHYWSHQNHRVTLKASGIKGEKWWRWFLFRMAVRSLGVVECQRLNQLKQRWEYVRRQWCTSRRWRVEPRVTGYGGRKKTATVSAFADWDSLDLQSSFCHEVKPVCILVSLHNNAPVSQTAKIVQN